MNEEYPTERAENDEEKLELDTAHSERVSSFTAKRPPKRSTNNRSGKMTESFIQKKFLGPTPGLGSVLVRRPKNYEEGLGANSVFRVQSTREPSKKPKPESDGGNAMGKHCMSCGSCVIV